MSSALGRLWGKLNSAVMGIPTLCWMCSKGTVVGEAVGRRLFQLVVGDREKLLVFLEKTLGEMDAMPVYV